MQSSSACSACVFHADFRGRGVCVCVCIYIYIYIYIYVRVCARTSSALLSSAKLCIACEVIVRTVRVCVLYMSVCSEVLNVNACLRNNFLRFLLLPVFRYDGTRVAHLYVCSTTSGQRYKGIQRE